MVIDARSVPENTTIETDVCIVGAGTAGLTLAQEFIGKPFRVCLVESGGLKPDLETQELNAGENIGRPYFSPESARVRYFGGSTNRWHIPVEGDCEGVRMRPLDPIDFEERDWVPFSGWPFDKAYLDPFYSRAQELCLLSPYSYDVEDWTGKNSLLPFKGDRIETVIFKFGSRRPFLDIHANNILNADNISTFLNANVTEIGTNEQASSVTHLKAACLDGNTFSVKSRRYILATGAIEIPRLLLSSDKVLRTGLGNENDLVGRFFMEHPHFWSGVLIPSDHKYYRDASLYDHIRRVNGVPILGKLSLSEDVLRKEKLLNYVGELVPRVVLRSSLNPFLYPAIESESVAAYKSLRLSLKGGKLPKDFPAQLRSILGGLDALAETAWRNLRKRILQLTDRRFVQVFRLANMSEQAPNPDSRITLGADSDRLGMKQIRLNWRLSGLDLQSALRSQEILDEEFRHSELGRMFIELNSETPPERITGGWHQMGTTRMHRDPRKGVVDEHCRVHCISNLFISGPSVFPTGGYANPSLTIIALAIRLADHIQSTLA
jgi:hypothetical protein